MEVKFDNLDIPAFIGETIDVRLEISNDEEEEAEASLDVRIIGYPESQGECLLISPVLKLN